MLRCCYVIARITAVVKSELDNRTEADERPWQAAAAGKGRAATSATATSAA